MADPISLTLGAVSVIGGVVSAAGQMAQGQAAAAAATANANALRTQAGIEQEQGVIAEQQQLRQGMIARGKSLAVLSASGVDPTSGSPLDLLTQQTRTNEFNAEEAKFQHDEDAWKMMVGAGNEDLAGSAALAKAEGGAIGSVVGGAGKLLGQIDFGTGNTGQSAGGYNPTAGVPGGGNDNSLPYSSAVNE